MQKVVLATGNPGKVRELASLLRDFGLDIVAQTELGVESAEETGLTAGRLHDWQQQNVWEIYPSWRHRYAPGVTHNTEHVFSLEVPAGLSVRLAPGEHTAACWLPWQAAAAQAFSPSNAEAIRALARQRTGASAD